MTNAISRSFAVILCSAHLPLSNPPYSPTRLCLHYFLRLNRNSSEGSVLTGYLFSPGENQRTSSFPALVIARPLSPCCFCSIAQVIVGVSQFLNCRPTPVHQTTFFFKRTVHLGVFAYSYYFPFPFLFVILIPCIRHPVTPEEKKEKNKRIVYRIKATFLFAFINVVGK